MSFAYRDRFSPDLDLSVFFGPGLSGIMQAIEHLNKQLRSKMHTWTAGKKSFLKSFLQNVYEVLVGKYVALKLPLKPSNFVTTKLLHGKGIEKGFWFPAYDPSNIGMCFSCRRVFENVTLQLLRIVKEEQLQTDQVLQNFLSILGTQIPIPKCYVDDGVAEQLPFKLNTPLEMTVQQFQKHFELFDMEKPICADCFGAYKMSCILLCETMDLNIWVPLLKRL